ncbi:MAG: segregation and condensation protein A [Gammaproteobacteria bacterium]|nr:segregation and condensation protein A [Gammaproteobacteria bacterium]
MDPETSKEYKILVTMRQVLSGIIRDITPTQGQRHPLSEGTMEDIKQCFTLIAAREKEITDEAGMPSLHRPHYVDERKKTNVVKLHTPSKKDD